MASDREFVEYVAGQLGALEDISYRNMFGEYVLYYRGKVVVLICDNRMLVKPTAAGRAFIGDVVEAPPYPGAKPAFLIEDRLEDAQWLCDLIRVTEKELPAPQPKKKRKK
ncbi:TfoX/Sxy family protein [bacterium]|nr:TfoX/Sxy family protein [bacterium]PJA77050.1 MAG: competence protein TfoX [bacterium CG_4_9_14_3_um_filter_65_15]